MMETLYAVNMIIATLFAFFATVYIILYLIDKAVEGSQKARLHRELQKSLGDLSKAIKEQLNESTDEHEDE